MKTITTTVASALLIASFAATARPQAPAAAAAPAASPSMAGKNVAWMEKVSDEQYGR